jgi:hypothetical protein
MLSGTILAIFFVPMFFIVVLRLFGRHGTFKQSVAPIGNKVGGIALASCNLAPCMFGP